MLIVIVKTQVLASHSPSVWLFHYLSWAAEDTLSKTWNVFRQENYTHILIFSCGITDLYFMMRRGRERERGWGGMGWYLGWRDRMG